MVKYNQSKNTKFAGSSWQISRHNGQSTASTTELPQGAILIIDDDSAIREALTDILSLFLKITIFAAASGDEGLQIFQQQSIALVILDMNMPGMNGEQTYEHLQQIAPQLKVIVSSSLSLAEARLRFGQREVTTFLQKPYDVDTLLNAVQAKFAMA
jgi:DNA-binding NtrC family response regulator